MAQVQQPLTQAQIQQAINVANARAQEFVFQTAYPVEQPLPAQRVDLTRQARFELYPAGAGLVTGFLLQVNATIKNSSETEAATLTEFGTANILKNVEYFDPNNNQRINCSGWLLNTINSVRGGEPFLESDAKSGDSPYGNNFNVLIHPKTIAAGATEQVRMYWYIPLAVSATSDLRGAVLANVAGSQQRLNLTFARNDEAFVQTGSSLTEAVYSGGTCQFESFEFEVVQHYYDQLTTVQTREQSDYFGIGQGGFIVPMKSLATYYKIENTVISGLSANSEREVQYGNAYQYLSTTIVYANGSELNAGSDVDYITQKSANAVNLNKLGPITWAAKARRLLKGADLPKATYFISNYNKPILTTTYGNMVLVFKPKVVNENARLLVGFEYTVESQTLVNAGTIVTA